MSSLLSKIQLCVEKDFSFYNNSSKVLTVIAPSVALENEDLINWDQVVLCLERIMRTCYKSETSITEGSAEKLVNRLIHETHHESTIEHAIALSFRIVCSRSISHELVRHRIGCSFSQESQRYVNYTKKGGMSAIVPYHLLDRPEEDRWFWLANIGHSFDAYISAITERGWTPQEARGFLPNDCKTELVATFNLRSLRHFLSLRLDKSAHPDMRVIADSVLRIVEDKLPVIFKDFSHIDSL